ncbi:MAG: hypothetical protein FWF76_07870 [Oscillospiraceae bacterium]|nr:hypothetical protein [Oscillospiraceae bacterium]
MAQVDTRHGEKDTLMALLIAKHFPEDINLQIAIAEARMEKEDIEEVNKVLERYKKTREKN